MSGNPQGAGQPMYFPPANYGPGDYPNAYYSSQQPPPPPMGAAAPPHPQQSTRGRPRVDSGVAPQTTAMGVSPPPSNYKYPAPGQQPQGYMSAPAPAPAPAHSQSYQAPPERTAYSSYSGPHTGPQPERGLHPHDAYQQGRSQSDYPQSSRRRGESDSHALRPTISNDRRSDRYTESEEEEAEFERRERRRRKSEGGSGRRRRKTRYEEDPLKRPTLADSTIWAWTKAKDYLSGR